MINWLLPLRQTDATAEPSITQQAGAAERAVDANHGVLAARAGAAGKRPGRGSEGKANADANGKARSALMIISRGWPGMSPWRHGRSVHPIGAAGSRSRSSCRTGVKVAVITGTGQVEPSSRR